MNKFTNQLLAALAFLSVGASSAYADSFATQKLMQFTNDRDASVAVVEWVTDAQGVTQGLSYTHDGKKTNFSVADLKKGAVLEAQQGVNALTLKGDINPAQGGTIDFVYVANGLTGSYKTCGSSLSRGANGEWVLTNTNTRSRIQTAKIITWQMGISTIEGVCAQ